MLRAGAWRETENDDMADLTPRSKLRRAGTRLFWRFGLRWYGFTARLGKDRGVPVRPAASIEDLVTRISAPNHYTADGFDTMRHPRLVQARIDAGKPIGDCDDHASIIAATLRKSDLAWRVYLATVHMQLGEEKAPVGHAFVLFRRLDSEFWWAMDYDMPVSGTTARAAIEQLALQFGPNTKPLFAGWMLVEYHDEDGLRLSRRLSGSEVWR
jgi:hypothetical protein